jgi:hypothetical protein
MGSARGDCWNTPPEYVAWLLEMWPDGIDLDPCSNATSIVPARTKYTVDDNGLGKGWRGRVFVNPPWSDPEPWYQTAQITSMLGGAEVVVLTHVATGTRWWREMVWPRASAVCFHAPRLNFLDADGNPIKGNPRDCSSTYYGADPSAFKRVFSQAGHVVIL